MITVKITKNVTVIKVQFSLSLALMWTVLSLKEAIPITLLYMRGTPCKMCVCVCLFWTFRKGDEGC